MRSNIASTYLYGELYQTDTKRIRSSPCLKFLDQLQISYYLPSIRETSYKVIQLTFLKQLKYFTVKMYRLTPFTFNIIEVI